MRAAPLAGGFVALMAVLAGCGGGEVVSDARYAPSPTPLVVELDALEVEGGHSVSEDGVPESLICSAVAVQSPKEPTMAAWDVATIQAWGRWMNEMADLLRQNRPVFQGIVVKASPQERPTDQEALAGVEDMIRVADEHGDRLEAVQVAGLAEADALEAALEAFLQATSRVCPNSI